MKLANYEFKTTIEKNIASAALLLFFSIAYSYISIVKHQHYQTFTWDTGFFDQLIWKLGNFKNPISTFSGLHAFGDHFQLVLLLLVPLYWLPKSLHLLFIAHAIVAVSSTIPIYILSIKFLKSKLLAFIICLSYLLFVPLQFAILDGFHQSVFSVLFYSLAIYSLLLKKHKLYWISIVGLLCTKEEMALLGAAIGIVAFFSGEKLKGLVTLAICLIAFFLMVNIILPSIQGYYPHSGYGDLGNTPEEVFVNTLKNPSLFIKNLISPSVKIETVVQTFLSFGFLPLASPTLLIPAAQQFIVRFIDTVTVHRWTNLNHYSFPIAPIMAVAAIFGVQKLTQKFNFKIYQIALYLLFFIILQGYVYHGPINSLLKKDFFLKKEWMKNNDQILNYLPKNAPAAATNNLGPHISQRDNFYLIGENNSADYLLFDLEDGPNKYSPMTFQQTKEVLTKEIKSGKYEIYKQFGSAYLLKRRQ